MQIENGTTVRVFVDTAAKERTPFPLPLDRNANKILLIASKLRDSGQKVVLVSKDFVMRVKAEAIGLEVEDYINLRASYDNLYKGYAKDRDGKEGHRNLFFKDNFLPIEIA